MSKRFVSISAVTDEDELKKIHEIYKKENIDFKIAIGYQVSNKSINQGTKSSRQPKIEDLENLANLSLDYGFIPAVHYHTKDNQTIVGDLELISKMSPPNLSLVQFNTLPPSLEVLEKVKDMGFEVIFKVAVSDKKSPQGGYSVWKGESVQDAETGKVENLIEQVFERKNYLDYVMFDPSHGTNLGLDLSEDSLAIRFGKMVVCTPGLNKIGLVYAGGINPSNVKNVVRSLWSFFPEGRISIDTESGVRKNNSLDFILVRDYLVNCGS